MSFHIVKKINTVCCFASYSLLQIGEIFVTILTFTNYFYINSPVMPLAVNVHERKFKSSHSLFWARVLCDIPALAK